MIVLPSFSSNISSFPLAFLWYLPPGTSKWHKIEPWRCCPIPENGCGHPLSRHAVFVNLIAQTTTPTSVRIQAGLDITAYPSRLTVTEDQMECRVPGPRSAPES
jgi:DDE family transposase